MTLYQGIVKYVCTTLRGIGVRDVKWDTMEQQLMEIVEVSVVQSVLKGQKKADDRVFIC